MNLPRGRQAFAKALLMTCKELQSRAFHKLVIHTKYGSDENRPFGNCPNTSPNGRNGMKTIGRRFRAAALIGAAALALTFAAGARAQNRDSDHDGDRHSKDNRWPYANTGRSPVLAVVGDIACQPGEAEPTGESGHELCINPKSPYTSTSLWQSQEATANQIEAMKPDAVAIAGDLQYQVGQYSDFEELVRFDVWRFQISPPARARQPRVL